MLEKLFRSSPRRRDNSTSGSVAVEFVLAAPLLVVLVLGVTDYGMLMNASASLLGATRAGAEYAKANWNNPAVTNPTAGIQQQVCAFFGVGLAGSSCSPVTPGSPAVTPSVTTQCTCADGSAAPTCPPTGPCGGADPRVLVYVRVQATQDFNPMFSVASFPLFGSFGFPTNPLDSSTYVRVQ